MKHPAPVLALVRRQAARIGRQRDRIAEQRRQIDTLKQEVAVQTRRANRWRRTALELAPKVGPRAMDVCLMQCQSEELADLPEVKR